MSDSAMGSGRGKVLPALALAGTLVLAACGGRPEGVLIPTPVVNVPGTSEVEMLVATTRAQDPVDRGVLFSGERGGGLSFVDITVSIPPEANRRVGEVQCPKRMPPDPLHDFTTTGVTFLDDIQARAAMKRIVDETEGKRALLFIHGFNNRFEDAVYRFAQFVHDAGAPMVPVLFTWPSRARLFSYNYDRESTAYSRDGLEATARALAGAPKVSEVTVLAHSMGAWLTVETLRQMAIRDHGKLPKSIRNVILAAPDVDIDVFLTQLKEIGHAGPAYTVFVSRGDRALAVSRRVWGSRARLGAIDPNDPQIREEFAGYNITIVDLTNVTDGGDSLAHSTFSTSPEVVRLLGTQLASGQTLTDSDVSLGDRIGQFTTGAAASVGSAAGLIVTAPIAIFDPNTRDTYGQRMGQFGETVGDTANAAGSVATAPVEALGGKQGARSGARPPVAASTRKPAQPTPAPAGTTPLPAASR